MIINELKFSIHCIYVRTYECVCMRVRVCVYVCVFVCKCVYVWMDMWK